ncbi:hypothetical protein ABPG74_006809 [Tetrahymena malaccensis]
MNNQKDEDKLQDLSYFICQQFKDDSWVDLIDKIDEIVQNIFVQIGNNEQLKIQINQLASLGLSKDILSNIKQEIQKLGYFNKETKKFKQEYASIWQTLKNIGKELSINKQDLENLFKQLIKILKTKNFGKKLKLFLKQKQLPEHAIECILQKASDYCVDQESLYPINQSVLDVSFLGEDINRNLIYQQNENKISYLSKEILNQNISQNIFESQNFQQNCLNWSFQQSQIQLNEETSLIGANQISQNLEQVEIYYQIAEQCLDQVYVRNLIDIQKVFYLIENIKVQKCNCVGFIGDFRVAYKILYQMNQNIIKFDFENSIYPQFDQLVAYTDGKTVYLVYKDSRILMDENPLENNDKSLYIRCILDTCQTIVLSINRQSVLNWSDINPFQNIDSRKAQFLVQDRQSCFKLKKIETLVLEKSKESQIMKCSLDCSGIIYTWNKEDNQIKIKQQYELNKAKVDQIFQEMKYEHFLKNQFSQAQNQELNKTMKFTEYLFLNNNSNLKKVQEVFLELKNSIKNIQNSTFQSSKSKQVQGKKIKDVNQLFNTLRVKDSKGEQADLFYQIFKRIYQKQGFCIKCTKQKYSDCKKCMNLQTILNAVIRQIKQIKYKAKTKDELVKEYFNNAQQFVQNLKNYLSQELITYIEESNFNFIQNANSYEQQIFVKKDSIVNIRLIFKEEIIKHAINTIQNEIQSKQNLALNIQKEINNQKEKVLQILNQQYIEEEKNRIILRPLISDYNPQRNQNCIGIVKNLYGLKLPVEAHQILNYFCFNQEIDFIATCNINSPKENQKVIIWKVKRKNNGILEEQIFENIYEIYSSDVCIHINSKSRKWIIFDNTNKRQATGSIKQDYSFSQEKLFNNIYSFKIKNRINFIKRVDSCFILNGKEDIVFVYEQENQQYYQISLTDNSIELKNFQIFRAFDEEETCDDREIFEDPKILKVFNCLLNQVYVFETENSLKITNLNYQIQDEVNIDRQNYIDFKIIETETLLMLIVIHKDFNIDSYVLANEVQDEEEEKNQVIFQGSNNEEVKIGNYLIDKLVESMKDYGQNFTQLGCPNNNNLFCFYESDQFNQELNNLNKKINEYLEGCFQTLQSSYQITFNENWNSNNIKYLTDQILQSVQRQPQNIPKDQLQFLLLTRIPIQISTIQQSNYYPLIDGQFRNLLQNQIPDSHYKLKEVKDLISFGWFEKVLEMRKKQPLYVIGIFGRQSVGKSSLLNRLFGTRFGVSVSRCTDGIWLGYSVIEETQILVLDCEGLFSTKRTTGEEIKLIQQITLISDISIIFTGLQTIDKQFQDILSHLALNNRKDKENDSFYSSLQVIIKDINGKNDIDKIQNELFPFYKLNVKIHISYLYSFLHNSFNKDLQKIREEILNKLFNKKMSSEETVSLLKYSIAQLFLDDDRDVQILLKTDQIRNIKNQFKKAFLDVSLLEKQNRNEFQILFTYEPEIEEEKYYFQQKSNFINKNDKESNKISYKILSSQNLVFDQRNLKLDKESLNGFRQQTISINRLYLQDIFQDKFDHLKRINHNNYFKQLQNFFDTVFQSRKQLIENNFANNLPESEKFKDLKDSFQNKLDLFILQFYGQFQICQQNCFKCKKRCVQKINHVNNCDCQTTHTCNQQCQKCAQEVIKKIKQDEKSQVQFSKSKEILNEQQHFQELECEIEKQEIQGKEEFHESNQEERDDIDLNIEHEDYQMKEYLIVVKKEEDEQDDDFDDNEEFFEDEKLFENPYQCQLLFGHSGLHLCNTKTHFCEETCQMSYNCLNKCMLEVNHNGSKKHDCKQNHECKQNCRFYEKCQKKCQLKDGHKEEHHLCNSDICFEKCSLCNKQCSFPRHDHELLIKDPIKNKQSLTLKFNNQQVEFIIDTHLCGDPHQCQQKCTKEGICNIDYQEEKQAWISNDFNQKFTYSFYKPIHLQQKCSQLIPRWQQKHDGNFHQCLQLHRCDMQCPECLSFCNKLYKHSGRHHTDMHRNKEQCIFLSKTNENISINDEADDQANLRKYKAGESAVPETCFNSCQRQGRAHFHLRECKGGYLCAENLYPNKAKHSKNKYYPNLDKNYDEILCKEYWNSINWETPLFKKQNYEKEIQLCNYACQHRDHTQQDPNFCIQEAWHAGNHYIQTEKCNHDLFYNNQIDICFTVDTTDSMSQVFDQMKKSVENIMASVQIQKFNIKFGIVCYRDHPDQDYSYGDRGLKFYFFTDQIKEVQQTIKGLRAEGGGDIPENVICALYQSCQHLNWRKQSLKIIIHIGDAPPHGIEYGIKSKNERWTKHGCPCGKKRKDVSYALKSKNIKYFMVKCSPNQLNLTEKLFKEDFGDSFRQSVEILNYSEINQKITDFVIKEITTSVEFYHVNPQIN